MRTSRLFACMGIGLFFGSAMVWGCSASGNKSGSGGNGAGAGGPNGGAGGGANCGTCFGLEYTPCDDNGNPTDVIVCPDECAPGVGCTDCIPGEGVCVGNDVHICAEDGTVGEYVETCDIDNDLVCSGGECSEACSVAEDQPSNIGCEFWAVDMDQVDLINDPASAPWGVAISKVGGGQANVTIEINEAAPGQPVQTSVVDNFSVPGNSLYATVLPTREVDCGAAPNDPTAPGTCLSSRAFRITSSAPIVVYQFNVFENAFSNDASLLLPTSALGSYYRVLGWNAGHPVPFPPLLPNADRSAVTIVGTADNTTVTIQPSWRIRGNPPIAATAAGGQIMATLGPFDVLNLETDDGTFQDDPNTLADLSGTLVVSNKPVAVFSGVETTSAPGPVDIPTFPGWTDGDSCCLDHLEEQMFPVESVGTKYVVTRSPIRSTSSYKEPDILRFVAPAEVTNVTTTLPAPYDSFTMQPGEVVTTWTQDDVIVNADKPVMVAQLLISQQYVDGPYTGDPALTHFPPVEQYRNEYIFLTPGSWTSNYVVMAAEVGSMITIDDAVPSNCVITAIPGDIDGVSYESRRCPIAEGAHGLSGDKPFGIIAYGYGSAGSYAFTGGADVKKIYTPPPLE